MDKLSSLQIELSEREKASMAFECLSRGDLDGCIKIQDTIPEAGFWVRGADYIVRLEQIQKVSLLLGIEYFRHLSLYIHSVLKVLEYSKGEYRDFIESDKKKNASEIEKYENKHDALLDESTKERIKLLSLLCAIERIADHYAITVESVLKYSSTFSTYEDFEKRKFGFQNKPYPIEPDEAIVKEYEKAFAY